MGNESKKSQSQNNLGKYIFEVRNSMFFAMSDRTKYPLQNLFSETLGSNCFYNFSCDSVDKLRSKLPSLEKEIQDANKFKEFYQFTFNYAKNPGQKGLDLDMALAYWNIVLKGKFRFLDVWTKFLKVTIFWNSS